MNPSTLIHAGRVLAGIDSHHEVESLIDDLHKLAARLIILRTALRYGLGLRPEVAEGLRGQLEDFGELALRLTSIAATLPFIDPCTLEADEPVIVLTRKGDRGC